MQELIRRKDVKFLAKNKFGFDLSPGQEDLVRKIAFREHRKLTVSAHTRWGKTQCAAIGIALLIDFGLPLKIAFIGPKAEQAGIIRQYMTELIFMDPSLLSKAMLTATGDVRILKEASRKRMKFNTGAEYRVFSAEGDADRVMGFGADVVVRDESCLIPAVADAKISRMLGDNPEEGMMVELYNPWERDNSTYEHTLNPDYEKIQIGWEQGVREGRITKEFVMEQKKEITPLEFTVLWESKFPSESEDSVFNLEHIGRAESNSFGFEKELQELEKKLEEKHKYKESEVRGFEEEIKKYTRIVSCDPADKGLDETVMFWGTKKFNKFQLIGWFDEPKSEQMIIAGRVVERAMNFVGRRVKGIINLDRIGIGAGALSRIKEVLRNKGYKNISVIGAHYGEAAIKKDHFLNKKAENFFRLQSIFVNDFIDIPVIHKLRTQLMNMKWEMTSAAKRKIIDPDKSPDWADALVYLVWVDKVAFAFDFLR